MNTSNIFDIRRNQSPDTREIQFYDAKNTLFFSIPDKSFIRLLYENGDHTYVFCQWIDQEHTEINGQKFNNFEFQNKIQNAGIICMPA